VKPLLSLHAKVSLVMFTWLLGCGSSEPRPRSSPPSTPEPTSAVDLDPEAWRKHAPLPGSPSSVTYPVPTVRVLPSGVTLYHQERPGGLVALSVVSRKGAAALPPSKAGHAAFMARMMTEGTRGRTSLGLAEAVEDLGSNLRHDAGRDHLAISMTVRAPDLDDGLELLAEIVRSPRFDPKDVDRVRAEWLDDLELDRDNPSRAALIAGFGLVLGEDAGAPVKGRLESIRSLRSQDLRAFHEVAFAANDVAVIVTGDCTLSALESTITKHFDALKAGPPPPSPAALPEPRSGVYVIDRKGSVQTALFVGQPLPRRSEAGTEARQILTNALGGLFTSRLNQNLRETHAYTYGAHAAIVAARHYGLLAIMTSVRTDATIDALDEILAELRALSDGSSGRPLTEDEVSRARTDLAQKLASNLEHVESVRSDLTSLFVDREPAEYLAKYPATLARLPLDAVRNEGRRLTPDSMVVVMVGDRQALEGDLQARGHHVLPIDPRVLR
jgi:zinc protease